ncbi:MAG: hypothetical protein J6R94_03000 [Agathobacter sp.]|nr:hypothetical protein [Agathobacter sp.]
MSKSKRPIDPIEDYDYLSASSATDCTGLIPSVTHNQEEVDHYLDLYPYLPPEVPTKGSDISRE